MNKKEDFKAFVKNHPQLISYVKNNEMTWQQFYEIYDIYGEDEETWNKYVLNNNVSSLPSSLNNIKDLVKGIDLNTIHKHIGTAQKALGVIEELTTKSAANLPSIKGPISPRPLTKFFGD
ncbi:MAG: hypothetical protein IJ574_00660 [Bacilli bacterium]|nr:hypothetical protein [Bacilli bacterium]